MFNKLFDGILDICKPGTDDPMCQFGGPLQKSNRKPTLSATEERPTSIWQKVKNFGLAVSGRKS